MRYGMLRGLFLGLAVTCVMTGAANPIIEFDFDKVVTNKQGMVVTEHHQSWEGGNSSGDDWYFSITNTDGSVFTERHNVSEYSKYIGTVNEKTNEDGQVCERDDLMECHRRHEVDRECVSNVNGMVQTSHFHKVLDDSVFCITNSFTDIQTISWTNYWDEVGISPTSSVPATINTSIEKRSGRRVEVVGKGRNGKFEAVAVLVLFSLLVWLYRNSRLSK